MHAIVTAESTTSAAARLVVRRLSELHPGIALTLVVTDPLQPPTAVDGATVIAARNLTVGGLRYIDAWLGGGPAFARWAVVPAAFTALGSGENTLVLPAESRVAASLTDLTASHRADTVALFARRHDESAGVSSGGWLPDLAVIGSDAGAVMAWWDGLVRDALIGPGGVDLDDPWRDFAVAGDSIAVVTDSSVRLSPHSIRHLELGSVDSTTTVDGRPLRLAQFPAFAPDRPWWYSTSPDADPPVLASDSAALRRICRDHASDLIAATDDPVHGVTERANGVLGIRHTEPLRRAVRKRLRLAAATGEAIPNPLDADTAPEFFAWLRDPEDAELTGVNVAADLVWQERPDLANAFPHVRWSDRHHFVRWLWTHGIAEGLISTALLPGLPGEHEPTAPGPTDATDLSPGGLRFGVNLVGYHDSDLGLGVAVRRVAAALDAAGIPWTKVTYDRTHSRRRGTAGGRSSAASPYRYNLILIAPDQLAFFVEDVGPEFLADHYNIGLWYWETDVLSDRQRRALDLVDEVWGSTQYLVDVFAAHTDKPVVRVPVPLEFPQAAESPGRRASLGLDERFTFLFTFDFFSIVERKNPLGLVEAYRAAFTTDDGCRLVLKSINGERHLAESEELRAAFADRDDIELWDRYLDSDERLALVADVDCYVSLHRSEGLGLTMAEAMAAGTPVIATGYSGNLDFMPPGSALLVDATEVEIGDGSFYPAHGHWAQPNLVHAAELLRSVRFDESLRADLAVAGPLALAPFTARRVGATIAERLSILERS